MDTRMLVSGVVVCAAAFITTNSNAADAPKEGTWTANITANGTILQSNPIGKSGDAFLNVSEEFIDNLDGGKTHCLWLIPVIKNTAVEPQGYCLNTDKDGDQVLTRTTAQTRPFSVENGTAVGEVITATGKYAGMMSSNVSLCKFSAGSDSSKYTANCEVRGTYKMP